MNKLQRFVADNCATYDGEGKCHLETGAYGDRTCVYFREHGGRCSYAENCVIPGDHSIEVLYWSERGVTMAGDICESCQQPFERKSNRQKYCNKCGELAEREKRRERDREYKARKRRFKD
jgi:hypothetical protein